MGGWSQAITSGIGEGANDVAKGAIANTEQMHQFQMDYLANQARNRQLDIQSQGQQLQAQTERAGQANQLTIAKGSQDIQRQAMEDAGYTYAGHTRNDDGSYQYLYNNPRLGKQVSFQSTAPPMDSYEYANNVFSQIQRDHPDIPKDVAMQYAFKTPMAVRDPSAMFQNYYQEAINHPEYLKKGESPRDFAQNMTSMPYSAEVRAMNGGFYNESALGALNKDEMALYQSTIAKRQQAIDSQYQAILSKIPPPGMLEGVTGVHAAGVQSASQWREVQEQMLNQQSEALLNNFVAAKNSGGGNVDLQKLIGAFNVGGGPAGGGTDNHPDQVCDQHPSTSYQGPSWSQGPGAHTWSDG